MRKFKRAVTATAMGVALSVSAAFADEVTFSSPADFYGASSELVGVAKFVEAMAGSFALNPVFDDFTIRVIDKGQLFANLSDNLEAVSSGAVQITYTTPQILETLEPDFSVVNVPGLFKDFDQFHRAMNSEPWQAVHRRLEDKGVTVLGWIFNPGTLYFFSINPLNSVEDFAGKKIRYPTGDAWRRAIEGLGAQPVAIPYTEVVTALQTNLLDGLITNFGGGVPLFNLERYAKHAYTVPLSIQPDAVVVNTDWWRGLSDEQRAAIELIFDVHSVNPYFEKLNSSLIDAWATQEGLQASIPADVDAWLARMAEATAPVLADIDQDLLDAIHAAAEE